MTEKTFPPALYAAVWRYVMPGAMFDEDGNLEIEPEAVSPFSAGYPSSVYQLPSTEDWVWTWADDFTPEQETEWAALYKKARQLAEPSADLSNEYNVLRAYYGESSPTGAQTVQALKAVIRVLREQAKDDD